MQNWTDVFILCATADSDLSRHYNHMIRAKITIVNKKDYRKYIKEVTFTYEGPANKLRRIFL